MLPCVSIVASSADDSDPATVVTAADASAALSGLGVASSSGGPPRAIKRTRASNVSLFSIPERTMFSSASASRSSATPASATAATASPVSLWRANAIKRDAEPPPRATFAKATRISSDALRKHDPNGGRVEPNSPSNSSARSASASLRNGGGRRRVNSFARAPPGSELCSDAVWYSAADAIAVSAPRLGEFIKKE